MRIQIRIKTIIIAILFSSITNYLKHAFDVVGIYLMWIVLHYVAANIYPVYCAQPTLEGFIMSIFDVPTPQCQALRFVISHGGTFINNMWIALGTYLCTKLCGTLFK